MQTRAISRLQPAKRENIQTYAEIEIPLVMDISELALLKRRSGQLYRRSAETGEELDFAVGTMRTAPGMCNADKIAAEGVLLLWHQ